MNRPFIKLLFLGIFILGAMACQSQTATEGKASEPASSTSISQSEPRDLSPVDFRNKVDRTPEHVLLDVRTERERLQIGFMLDSKHIDFYRQDFNEQLEQLDKEKTYFVYCRSGARSGKTVDQLRAKGIKAYNLDGGFTAWKEAFPF
jgi:rhodanese-related sulfurtransferase